MKMKLVFATHNKNKFEEIKAMIPSNITLVSLTDIGCHEDIAETANTIEGNAFLKAKYVFDKYNLPCFSDDTGLEVRALNNEPGVNSARYAGDHDSDANTDKLLANLENENDRFAQFKTAIVLITQNLEKEFTGVCKGEITKMKRGDGGFGYDPVFQPEGYSRTFAEMTQEEKAEIGHRGKAMRKLIDFLSEL